MLDLNEKIEILRDLAFSFNDESEVYEGYSGRGMYGKRCYGITTDRPMQLIEAAVENGIKGASMDSMGLQTIVYWTNIPYQQPSKIENDDFKNEIEIIKDLAIEFNEYGKVLQNGYKSESIDKKCYAIMTFAPIELIECAESKGIKGAECESSGTQTIVYWTNIPYEQDQD